MTKVAVLLAVLTWSFAIPARAQCCGDCNGDGMVTINELITAVNNALLGCGAATPTAGRTPTPTRKPTATRTPAHCALSLTTGSNQVCDFQGTYNRGCGDPLNSVLVTDGRDVTVVVGTMLSTTPFVYFAAHADSPTTATLQAWSPDAFQTVNRIAGSLQLNDNGTQLIVFPNDPPFFIQSCQFVEYIGTYTGNTVTSPQLSGAANPHADETGAGLRTRLDRPLPNLGAP